MHDHLPGRGPDWRPFQDSEVLHPPAPADPPVACRCRPGAFYVAGCPNQCYWRRPAWSPPYGRVADPAEQRALDTIHDVDRAERAADWLGNREERVLALEAAGVDVAAERAADRGSRR